MAAGWDTRTITCGDEAAAIDDLGKDPQCPDRPLFITVEDASVRLAFYGATPTQAGLGHLYAAGAQVLIPSHTWGTTVQAINAVNGDNATLQVSGYFTA